MSTGVRSPACAHPPADLQAVEPGHAHVEDDRVRRPRREAVERRGAIRREIDVVALERERALERGPDGGLVVDDQDLHFQSIVRGWGFPVSVVGD